MFSLKSKLEPNLRIAMENNYYKHYKVLIHCKHMCDKIHNVLMSHNNSVIRYIPTIQCISALVTSQVIEKLLEYPQIDFITFDNYAILCGSSVLAANGIHFQSRYKLTGKDITIGIVDSGLYPHSDILNPENRIKKFTDLINEYQYPYDDNGHGTFISGLICGSGYSSKGMYKGIAEKSNIYMIKAFNQTGKGYISDILFSIELLLNHAEDYNIRVICLPFEIIHNDYFILNLFSKLFDIAISKNIVVVVPSGNNGPSPGSIRGISILKNCITVGGVDTRSSSISACSFSSSGPFAKLDKPDLCAASEEICSIKSDTYYISEKNGRKIYPNHLETPYTNFSGTSCSAAYIAGLCALLLEKNSSLTFSDIVSILKVSCKLQKFSKWNQGAGTVDLSKCLL